MQLVERISTAASTACSGENEQNISKLGRNCLHYPYPMYMYMKMYLHVHVHVLMYVHCICFQLWTVCLCWLDCFPFCLRNKTGGFSFGLLPTSWRSAKPSLSLCGLFDIQYTCALLLCNYYNVFNSLSLSLPSLPSDSWWWATSSIGSSPPQLHCSMWQTMTIT